MTTVPVHVRVMNRQTLFGEEPQELELVTEARYSVRNGQHFLVYDESVLSGTEAGKTCLKIGDGQVQIRRYGQQESLLQFEAGKRFVAQYPTPMGMLRIELTTQLLEVDLKPGPRGTIRIQYALMMQSTVESRNEINIEIF